jgi:hypothetical protein
MTKKERQELKASRNAYHAAKTALAHSQEPLPNGTEVLTNKGTGFEGEGVIVALVPTRFGFSYKVRQVGGPYDGVVFQKSAGAVNAK